MQGLEDRTGGDIEDTGSALPLGHKAVDALPQPVTWPPQPWECPRCRRVNAPFVAQCPCAGTSQGTGMNKNVELSKQIDLTDLNRSVDSRVPVDARPGG